MGDVEGMVAEPGRFCLHKKRRWELRSQREDLASARVIVTPTDPLIAYLQSIQSKPTLVIDPHRSCWVIPPTRIRVDKCLEQLQTLNSLLTQSLHVQRLS